MTYKFDSRFIGYPPIEGLYPTAALAPVGQPWPPVSPGLLAAAEAPDWGPGEFLFGQFGGAVRQFALCVLTPTWNTTTRKFDMLFTECPNTANLGRPVYVAMAESGPTGAVSGQFGWFLDSGVAPVNGTVSVAAATAFGITAAGQIGANSAGKQILNAVCVDPATRTQTKTVIGAGNVNQTGQFQIGVNNVDGLFVGGYASGTGVGASAIITAIDRINNIVTVSVANTALVTTFVQTNNNATIFYNTVLMDRSLAQGAIT